jgi:hypothetical protein
MRRPQLFRLLGVVVVGLIALGIGTRPALKAQQPSATIAPAFIGGAFGGGAGAGQQAEPKIPPVYLPSPPMTVAETKTRLKLHDKIPMRFPTDTPLADVVKYIEDSTVDKADFPEGLSIYVDPLGLQDADKTMADTITINLKNLPLETTLDLVLKQLDLTYWVNKDGLLIITAASDELVTPSTLDREILSTLSSLRSEVHALRAEVRSLRRGGVPEARPNGVAGGGGMGGVGGMM